MKVFKKCIVRCYCRRLQCCCTSIRLVAKHLKELLKNFIHVSLNKVGNFKKQGNQRIHLSNYALSNLSMDEIFIVKEMTRDEASFEATCPVIPRGFDTGTWRGEGEGDYFRV